MSNNIEEEMNAKLDELKNEWLMAQLPRAVSICADEDGCLTKLYSDGAIFSLDSELNEWFKYPDDGYIKECLEKLHQDS